MADPELKRGCDHGCLRSTICRMGTTEYSEKTRCNQLEARLQIAVSGKISTLYLNFLF